MLFVLDPPVAAVPGHRPGARRGLGRGRGFTVNLPVAPGSGDATFRSLVDHVVVPLARAYRAAAACSISAGFDAHARIRWPSAG